MVYPLTIAFPLHWGEMDALGHANNACFFRWFESARIALFAKIGVMGEPRALPNGVGPILVTTTCDFLRPVVHPAELLVGVRVAKIGETSITMEYALWRADAPDAICARGSSVAVLVDYATNRKVRVPDSVRAAIEALSPDAGAAS